MGNRAKRNPQLPLVPTKQIRRAQPFQIRQQRQATQPSAVEQILRHRVVRPGLLTTGLPTPYQVMRLKLVIESNTKVNAGFYPHMIPKLVTRSYSLKGAERIL